MEKFKADGVIDIQRFMTKIGETDYKVHNRYLLQRLIAEFKKESLKPTSQAKVTWSQYPLDSMSMPKKLTQDFLWATLGPYFKPGDLVIAETGTSAYGLPASNLMHVGGLVEMFSQTVFGSIEFATGAALGAFVAGREKGTLKRGILITGEGSLQLTVQAFSDLMRHDLNCSSSIMMEWDYAKIPKLFAPTKKFCYYSIKTPEDLLQLMKDEEFATADCTQIVELFLDRHDAPHAVLTTTSAIEEFNRLKE
ncbi:hypothetical protein MMC25_007436 [Agyrium rufum]|nr:hypothetical protein [Agyrium rufum]